MGSRPFSAFPLGTRAYIVLIAIAGASTVILSLADLIVGRIDPNWLFLAALTLASGSATVHLGRVPVAISVSEAFVFTSAILFGASAGTLTVALDAAVISFWSYRKGQPFYKIAFNICALPLTIWIGAHLFFLIADVHPLFDVDISPSVGQLILPLAVFTLVYFLLSSWIISIAIALERQLSALTVWRENFLWISLNYFGGASIALLLVSYSRNIDFVYLIIAVPLLAILYVTYSIKIGRVQDANLHLLELNALYMSTIETLAMAIDAKDQVTHGHIRRVQAYAVGLANRLGVSDPKLIKAIEAAALLHDMGKLAVPEYILNKPGPLTSAEFEKMKLHASVGADILSSINFPYPVVPIVRHHHENWDGSGYPQGISGTDIPIGARILSVVDCFDALTSDRPYRPKLSDDDAIAILLQRRGSMYDPLVVDKFIEVHSEIGPPRLPEIPSTSLRAITEAAVSATAVGEDGPLEEISASTEEMLTLFDLARGLSSRMNLHDAGDVIAKHVRRLIPCSLVVVFLYEIEKDELIVSHASGDGSTLIGGLRLEVGQRLSGWVAANRRAIRNSDAVLDLGDSARSITPRPRSSLSVPLATDGGLVGVITLYSPVRHGFTSEHQRLLEIIGRQISPILRDSAEFERAKSGRLRDRITGLPNANHLHELRDTQLLNVRTQPTTVLMFRVCSLNIPVGAHAVGVQERILQTIVAAIRRNLRTADLLFRYGTEDFLVLLFDAGSDAGQAIGVRVIEAVGIDSVTAGVAPIEVRFATASSPADGVSLEELVRAVDTQLVKAIASPRDIQKPDSIH